MSNRYFADISNNNPEFIATAYKHAGHILVALKVTEGLGFLDPTYHRRVREAHAAGLHVAHYHFARPDNHINGRDEADFFCKEIHGFVAKDDILVLDLETDPHHPLDDYLKGFESNVHKHFPHYPVILYSYSAFLAKYNLKPRSNRYWIANYSGRKMSLLVGVRNWAHQFTDGRVGAAPHTCTGIGTCDVSRLNMASYRRLKKRKVTHG